MLTVPKKTITLETLELLRRRGKLNAINESHYYRLMKGYEGEKKFAEVLKKELLKPYIVLYGILMENDKSLFQIDCLIISKGIIYLIDVKYFSDEYYFHNNDFYLIKNKEKVDNPLHQLQRCESLFRKLLEKHHFRYEIRSYISFVHPEFTLYAAPFEQSIILPSQLRRFIIKLNHAPIQITTKESKLVDFIYQKHQKESIFDTMPEFYPSKLEKGITCIHCNAMMRNSGRGKLKCEKCRAKESVESAVLRVQLLNTMFYFPMKKLLPIKYMNGVVNFYREK